MASFNLVSGSLTGPATLDISTSLTWSGGASMSGSGSTVVQPSASGSVSGTLSQRTLINEGTLSLGEAELYLTEGAELRNTATFIANYGVPLAIGSSPFSSFVNTGKFRRTSGTESTGVQVNFVNEGTVEATTGSLAFAGGGSGIAGSKWLASPGAKISFGGESAYHFTGGTWQGTIGLYDSSKISTEGIVAEYATVEFGTGASWDIPSGTTTVAGFALSSGNVLEGSGNLKVSGSFDWHGGTMIGSGSTTVESSAAGTIAGNLERGFVNEGSLTLSESELYMGEGAYLTNRGTFIANYEAPFAIGIGSKPASHHFINLGVFRKTTAGTTGIEVPFINVA